MRDFLADMRTEYASMTRADWANWIISLVILTALLVWILSQA